MYTISAIPFLNPHYKNLKRRKGADSVPRDKQRLREGIHSAEREPRYSLTKKKTTNSDQT